VGVRTGDRGLCSLISAYLAGALRSARAGIVSGSIFAATYAVLYLLVTSESYALLAGSLALFACWRRP